MVYAFDNRSVSGAACVVLATLCACGPGFVNSGDVNAPGSLASGATSSGGATGSDNSVPTTCGVDAYTNFGQQFFITNCDNCHAVMADYNGIVSDMNAIISQIQSNEMPAGFTLSADDKARVLAWLNCNAPQNPTATNATTTGGSSSTSTTTTGGTSTTTTGGTSTTSTGGAGTSCTTDTYTNFAQAFFASNCTSCHKSGGSASPSLTTLAAVKSDSASVNSQISQGLMPPSPSTISASDKQRIETWISCGLPQ